MDKLSHKASQFWDAEDYAAAEMLYQQALEMDPGCITLYWYLGLTQLLQGNEEEASIIWMSAVMDGTPTQVEQWSIELNAVLEQEAIRQESLEQFLVAWTIRQHQREINPSDLNNLLRLIQLSITLQNFSGDELKKWEVIDALSDVTQATAVNGQLLFDTLKKVLHTNPCFSNLPEWIDVSLPLFPTTVTVGEAVHLFLLAATEASYAANHPYVGIEYALRCLKILPDSIEILTHLIAFYHEAKEYRKAIETAQTAINLAKTLPDQICANFYLLRSLNQAGGNWDEAMTVLENHRSLLQSFIVHPPQDLDRGTILRLVQAPFALPYCKDDAVINRQLQNGFIAVCQKQLRAQQHISNNSDNINRDYLHNPPQLLPGASSINKPRLKVGYVSYCFRTHSVGWLARWLIKYHDRDQFELYGYFVNYRSHVYDSLQEWFKSQFEHVYLFARDGREVANQIHDDNIDILIDLDSITADLSFEIMALKPAPIQATWLGWDASGLPAVDYFIADPYVLPKEAESYYNETLWRLPQTFIAVDGFEIGLPNIRREQLEIPESAVIYLSSQVGHKRHPDNVRLQMEILKNVPNSYLLIKGKSDRQSMESFFHQAADEIGLPIDRLKFLPLAPSEAIHRANLGIADVVLDTYPYNGATTTLETLWVGIPLVTRVGQQFSARNSYTMMENVGVREGIAWSDDEYVEWGIRLGNDPKLRQKIRWQLLQSRHTSPLWNGKQFAQEMETAYRQMWVHWKDNN